MKAGINLLLWTDKPSAQHLPLLGQIQRWGFDGVEFPVLAMEPKDVQILGRRCDELGLKRTCIAALTAESADPTHPDRALREAALVELKKCIDKTQEIGADILVGPFHQGLGRFTGKGPTDEDLQRSAEVIRKAAEYAATAHIDLAIEPLNRFEMFLTNTVDAAAQFVTRVGIPNVGILADTHHANIEEENPAESWRRVIRQIKHVHISENHRGIPGSGQACTAGIFQMLRETGYDRWLTIEAFGLQVPGLIQPLHLWRPLFDKEEDVAVLGLKHIREGWANAQAHPA
ncbi:MAG: sugar phosphate isomerase/epimerase family protein [Terriglobia bacterium]